MTSPTFARRGDILPEFTLRGIDGTSIVLESYRGRTNLVVVCAGHTGDEGPVTALVEEFVAQREALTFEAAQVLVVVTARPRAVSPRDPWPFPVLVDEGASIHRTVGACDAEGRPASAVFVTDRFREIYGAWHGSALPTANEILDWLGFINRQCPECGWPEWPVS